VECVRAAALAFAYVDGPEPNQPQATPPAQPSTAHGRPTGWIVATVVCALAAIGLLVWALVINSDLSDKKAALSKSQRTASRQRATIARQNAAISSQTQQSRARVAAGQRLVARAKRTYAHIRAQFITAARAAVTLNLQLAQAETKLAQANTNLMKARQTAAGPAQTAAVKSAQITLAQARADLTAVCARELVDAMRRIFSSPTTETGVNAQVARLQGLQATCAPLIR
jgi:hypothetical protein